MKLRLTLGIIGGTLMIILAPSIQPAQANDYGTSRQLRTCPSRTEPRSGRISVEQAKKYVACYYEERAVFDASVKFVDILSLQIAPKPRRVRDVDLNMRQIDIEKPVYELRGSLIEYTCYNILGSSKVRGKNCSISRVPKSTGKCYQTTFGEWYCVMGGSSLVRPETQMPAPEAVSSSGRPENNEPESNRLTRINPNEARSYNDSGVLKYNKLKDYQGALADYDRAIKIDPNLAQAYYNRGVVKNNKLNDIQGGLTDYNRAIELNPNLAEAYGNRGILKVDKLNDIQGALADFNRAIKINPNFAHAYYNRSFLKKKYLNDSQGALADMKQAAKLSQQQGNTEEYQKATDLVRQWS